MKTIATLIAASALAATAVGCSVEVDTEAPVGESEEAACANPEGTNAMIAALAASMGRELHRWNVGVDLELYRGLYNQEMLRLSYTGRQQCGSACANTDYLLSFQDPRADQTWVFPGGIKLSSWSYAARLVAGWRAQRECDSRGGCPAEPHKLTQTEQRPSTECANSMVFKYNATAPSGAALMNPAQLRNKLIWANNGSPDFSVYNTQRNAYLQFNSTPSTVEVDPVPGCNDGDTYPVQSGLLAVCTTKDQTIKGLACICNNVTGVLKNTNPYTPLTLNCAK